MREAATVVLFTADLDEVEVRYGSFTSGRYGAEKLASAWTLADDQLRTCRTYCPDQLGQVRYVDVIVEQLDPATHTVLDARTETFEVWNGRVIGRLRADATL